MNVPRLAALILAAALLAGCAELRDLRERTAIQEREIARLRSDLAEQQQAHAGLVEQYEDMQASLQGEVQQMRSENDQLRTSQSQREQELAAQAAQLQENLRMAQTALSTHEVERTQLATQAQTLQQQLADTTAARDALQSQVQEIEQDLARLSDIVGTSQAGRQQAEQTATSLNDRLAQVTAGLEARNQEIQTLHGQLEQVQQNPGGYSDAELQRIADYLQQTVQSVSGPRPTIRHDAQRGVIVTFPSGDLFEPSSTAVTGEARRVLATLGQALAQLPETSVNVIGHTDNTPVQSMPFPDNWSLSASRAENVMRVLLSDGDVPQERLRFSGAGESQPAEPNTTPEGRAANRRVEICVVPDRPSS